MTKLPRDQRRELLIDQALEIVRTEGADALTLATLAARAGVSRPVAYEHFTTRPGLLLAAFQRLEDRYVEQLRSALSSPPSNLLAVAEVMSRAYFNCHADLGAEGRRSPLRSRAAMRWRHNSELWWVNMWRSC
jgi:AcrR family transcriptional regulator